MTRRKIAETAHVRLQRDPEWNEYRVSYKGVHPDRAEAMAYYTDDLEDAHDTMASMERNALTQVDHRDISDRNLWSDVFTHMKKV